MGYYCGYLSMFQGMKHVSDSETEIGLLSSRFKHTRNLPWWVGAQKQDDIQIEKETVPK